MAKEKLVFLQVEESHKEALLDLLSKFNDSDFHFFILPLDAKIIRKDELKELLENASL